jgi:sec-independent protein translocase protein TatB
MFGFSLAELLMVALVALLLIKPQDLPEIAHFLGKIFFRSKKYFNELKQQFEEVKKDLDFQEIKNEINRGIAEEKSKLEELDETIIVDIYGNEHRVPNVENFRTDLSKEEIEEEIKKLNEENLNSSKSV